MHKALQVIFTWSALAFKGPGQAEWLIYLKRCEKIWSILLIDNGK